MKPQFNIKLDMIKKVLFIASLFLPSSFLPDANARQQSSTPVNSAQEIVESINEKQFDGQGLIDAIIQHRLQPTKSNQTSEELPSLIIEGNEHHLSNELQMFHYLGQPVTVDKLKAGDLIGFLKDPADMIREIWILKPDLEKTKKYESYKPVLPPAPEQSPAPETGKRPRNENGIWRN
jgi:hypothetical protein